MCCDGSSMFSTLLLLLLSGALSGKHVADKEIALCLQASMLCTLAGMLCCSGSVLLVVYVSRVLAPV